MKALIRKLMITVLLGVVIGAIIGNAFQQPTQPSTQPQPIRIDEADALRIQVAYQNLQLVMLGVEKKYAIKDGWAYNFNLHQYEPPSPSTPPEQKPLSPKP